MSEEITWERFLLHLHAGSRWDDWPNQSAQFVDVHRRIVVVVSYLNPLPPPYNTK